LSKTGSTLGCTLGTGAVGWNVVDGGSGGGSIGVSGIVGSGWTARSGGVVGTRVSSTGVDRETLGRSVGGSGGVAARPRSVAMIWTNAFCVATPYSKDGSAEC
jgi:hypothetical protein